MMKKIVFLLLISILLLSNASYAKEVANILDAIEENAGTGENGLPKDIVSLLQAKDELIKMGHHEPEKVVALIVSRLNPDWKYSKRGWAYRIALLEVLTGIGNKVPSNYIPVLQEIVNDESEKNDYVKMQAFTVISVINSEQGTGHSGYGDTNLTEGNEKNNELFSELTAVKYRDMKEEMGLYELVKKSDDLPKETQIKLARIMVNDEDVFAQYQGAIKLHGLGLMDESKQTLIKVLENVYKSNNQKSGRIVYSMVHIFDDEFLNDIFVKVHKKMIKEVDYYSDEVVERVYKSYALKKSGNLKDTIEEKKQQIKEAMRSSIEKMDASK